MGVNIFYYRSQAENMLYSVLSCRLCASKAKSIIYLRTFSSSSIFHSVVFALLYKVAEADTISSVAYEEPL